MHQVQRPPHRLAVSHNQIKMVETIQMGGIKHALHDPMHRNGRNRKDAALPCSLDDCSCGVSFIHAVNQNSEQVLLLGLTALEQIERLPSSVRNMCHGSRIRLQTNHTSIRSTDSGTEILLCR